MGLEIVVAIFSILGSLVGILFFLINLSIRFHRLERHDKADYDARCVMMKGLYAALDGMHQLGANGEVTRAHQELKEYLIKQ